MVYLLVAQWINIFSLLNAQFVLHRIVRFVVCAMFARVRFIAFQTTCQELIISREMEHYRLWHFESASNTILIYNFCKNHDFQYIFLRIKECFEPEDLRCASHTKPQKYLLH